MKKIISFVLAIPIIYANAGTLTNITSGQDGNSQIVNFIFDNNTANPLVMSSGNDLILDFAATSNGTAKSQYLFDSGYINKINLAGTSQKLRMVLSGGANYKYTISPSSNNIKITFNEQIASPAVTPKTLGTVFPKNSLSGISSLTVNDVKFSRDDKGGGVIEVAYAGNNQINVKEQRLGEKLVLNLNEVAFNNSILKHIDASDFATPVKMIDVTKGNSNQLNLTFTNRGLWDYAIYQLQGKLVINIRNTRIANGEADSIPSLNQGKSDRISLNFQNIDVRALLQLLADFSGYNILVSDSVNGTISLKLNSVPWDQALQIILTSKGLGMRRDGNVIRIAPVSELSALSKMQQDSQRAQEAVEPLDSLTIRLKYAQAATVQGMLQTGASGGGAAMPGANGGGINPATGAGATGSLFPPAAGNNTTSTTNGTDTMIAGSSSAGMLSSRGSILVDTRTNTLIINDTPSRLKDIKELIDKIDIPVKQVLIEARIVEASNSFERDLGTRLFLAGLNSNLTVSNTLENAIKINQGGIGQIGANPKDFINSNMMSGKAGAISAIYQPDSNALIGLEVDALETLSEGRTISSPKVITANYQPANIQQGVQIPYQQASSAGNTNIAFVNATLSLQVTPQITEDGNIMLDVQVQKNTPSNTIAPQGTPGIDTSSVQTNVLVQDGATVLLGGIFEDKQSTTVMQIPGLGDIPYLGWLFKSQVLINNKKELLIFITPRILTSNSDVSSK